MRFALLLLTSFLLWACSKKPIEATVRGTRAEVTTLTPEALRVAANADEPAAQRELAGRLLFGKGMPKDIPAALEWTEKAARNSDPTASVWMGRKFLNDPLDRVSAVAWFLIARNSGDPAAAQDARGELEALAPSADELSVAKSLASEWKRTILRTSK